MEDTLTQPFQFLPPLPQTVQTIQTIQSIAQGDANLHRVGRAGRFGTKGLAISFISSEEDQKVLEDVQGRFEVNISDLPDQIDITTYMNA